MFMFKNRYGELRSGWSVVALLLLTILGLGVGLLSLFNTFLAGMLFAYMFIKSGKLWLSSGFHIAWNYFQGDIFQPDESL